MAVAPAGSRDGAPGPRSHAVRKPQGAVEQPQEEGQRPPGSRPSARPGTGVNQLAG